MRLKYYKVNPGGNNTAIVLGNFNKKNRIIISKFILRQDSAIEQVGFWVMPNNRINKARLQMMGGEFCGNAARSLAYLIWQKNKSLGEFFIEAPPFTATGKVDGRRSLF